MSQTDESPTTLSKTPTYEYYGFVLYLLSFIAFAIYLLWAYLPKEVLESLGITYYPDRRVQYLFLRTSYCHTALIIHYILDIGLLHYLYDDNANVGQNLSQLSKITDDFVPELHDIPI
ncbi:31460_t:CDS:2, partial [Gigaspora margarita]